MKVQNLNNSSLKTRKLIKNTFMQMLSEKKELGKITISELVRRADISRATFYSHFDDIYDVVQAFEEELIENFFTNAKLLATDNYEKFFEELFAFLKENDANYKMMCQSNDMLYVARRLSTLAVGKLSEIVDNDPKIKDKASAKLDLSIFFEGIMCEYIKYCRNLTNYTQSDLYDYAKGWYKRFLKEWCK